MGMVWAMAMPKAKCAGQKRPKHTSHEISQRGRNIMKHVNLKNSLAFIAGASAVTLAATGHAASNPFQFSSDDSATIVVAEQGTAKSISVLEGKCGSGKCGSARIRQMMDRNADGKINRDEYVSWAGAQAAREFEEMSEGKGSIDAEAVYQHYLSLTQGIG